MNNNNNNKIMDEGRLKSGAIWKLSYDGILIIEGIGSITDYVRPSNVPWYKYRKFIKSVYIGNGITAIGSFAFYGCVELSYIFVSGKIIYTGDKSFFGCNKLTNICYI